MRCEYDDCSRDADGWVEAQWTIADFVRYDACDEHLEDIADVLGARTVEGFKCWPAINHYDSWYHDSLGQEA